jgi:hypothetical protein
MGVASAVSAWRRDSPSSWSSQGSAGDGSGGVGSASSPCRARRTGRRRGDTAAAPNVQCCVEQLGRRATPASTCRRSFGTNCAACHPSHALFSMRIDVGIVHGSRLSQGNQGFRGARIGGNHFLAATSGRELQPRPARSGTRSRYDSSGRTSPLKSCAPGGKPKGSWTYPTDRILGGCGAMLLESEVEDANSPRLCRPRSAVCVATRGPAGRGRGHLRCIVEVLVATSGSRARLSRFLGRVPRQPQSRSGASVVAGGFPSPACRLRAALARGGRARWVPGASGCSHPGVPRCSASRRVAGLRARERTPRGFAPIRR